MQHLLLLALLPLSVPVLAQERYIACGTYTVGKSQGLYLLRFDSRTGKAAIVSTYNMGNPSYLAVSPNGKNLYVASENEPIGEVTAFAFDEKTGELRKLNSQTSHGSGSCYISEDLSHRWAVVANYGSGTLGAFPINADGSVAPAAQIIAHTGAGPVKGTQDRPHVHSVIFSPDEAFLYVADLGTDKEYVYKFDPRAAQPLADAPDSVLELAPGSGPRHIAFHPSRPDVYILSELSGTIDACHQDPKTGRLTGFQRLPSTEDGFSGDPGSADIHMSADGKFLYATNRGVADNISTFAVAADGTLTRVQTISANGKHPRNFVIDPSGKFLLVANKNSDNVVIFRIDATTGKLTPTGNELSIPNPICLKFLVARP